ncbi:MAG: hypothetical protein ABIO89_07555 [Cryobacterium sp.]
MVVFADRVTELLFAARVTSPVVLAVPPADAAARTRDRFVRHLLPSGGTA